MSSAAAAQPPRNHSLIEHSSTQEHHHHAHTPASRHAGGHHLLQVEGLNIGFTLYESSRRQGDDRQSAAAGKGDDGLGQSAGAGRAQHVGQDSKAGQAPFFAAQAFLRARQNLVPVIHDLHVSVHAGEIVAIVGASGSGKTLLADAIMGMFEPNATVKGRIWFDGEEQDARSLAQLRGNGISLVPQSINHLDPLMKVGKQVQGFAKKAPIAGKMRENRAKRLPMREQDLSAPGHSQSLSGRGTRKERVRKQQELFARYGLTPKVAQQYPFELSGGMARRVLLCCALMDNPRVIIADEPTPGLDLELARLALADFRDFANAGGGVLLITHDIELALQVADRVAVFNDGTVVEETAVAHFASPVTLKHPFSRALWHALPEHDFAVCEAVDKSALLPFDGDAPC
jgi:ABC-type dipeptide/oligopeptide/nickel transport system ATPase component